MTEIRITDTLVWAGLGMLAGPVLFDMEAYTECSQIGAIVWAGFCGVSFVLTILCVIDENPAIRIPLSCCSRLYGENAWEDCGELDHDESIILHRKYGSTTSRSSFYTARGLLDQRGGWHHDNIGQKLADMNDEGKSFEEIADFIETELKI